MRMWMATLVAGLVCGGAWGADLFTCKVKEQGQTVTVKFGLKNLDDARKIAFVDIPGLDEYEAVVVTPKRLKDGYFPQMSTLNDQGGDVRVTKTGIKLFGDGDGYTYVDLVLYKNSGYTRGYVRIYGSVDEWYQKIHCTRKKL